MKNVVPVIAWRYAFSSHNRHRMTSILLAIGICVAMTALTLILAFMSQLQSMRFEDIKALDTYSMQVSLPDTASFEEVQELSRSIALLDGVDTVVLFADVPVIARNSTSSGAVLKIRALDEHGFSTLIPSSHISVYGGGVPGQYDSGKVEALISWDQLAILDLSQSSDFQVTALVKGRTAAAVPRSFSITPSGIFGTSVQEFDSSVLLVDLTTLLEVIPQATVQIGVHSAEAHEKQIRQNIMNLHPDVGVITWKEQYATLYSAMALEKHMMTILTAFLIVVILFMLIHASRRLLHYKQKEMAALAVLGLHKACILSIAVLQSVWVSLVGVCAGFVLSHTVAALFPSFLHLLGVLQNFLAGRTSPLFTLPLTLHVDTGSYMIFSVAILLTVSIVSYLSAGPFISRATTMESILNEKI